MMGVEISGPMYVHGDNMSAINNTQQPESVLKKKSNEICYHAIHESIAMNESHTGHIPTNENVADLVTKAIMVQAKCAHLVNKLLYDLYNQE